MQGIRANRRKRIIFEGLFMLLLLALIAIDQLTKYHFSTTLELHEEKSVIDGFFYFTYTINTGAAWSFLANVSWSQLFFKILTGFALIAFMIFYIYAARKNYKWLRTSLILVISGTIGNFIDRLFNNGVTDFLGFIFGDYHFPIFNLADSFLVVGVIMLIIHYLFIDEGAVFRKKNGEKTVSSK